MKTPKLLDKLLADGELIRANTLRLPLKSGVLNPC